MRNFRYYIPGTLLILMAILIVAVPEILVAFVAASIIMVGIGALIIGHTIRKSQIEFRTVDRWFSDEGLYDWRCIRAPVFRKWYRRF